MLAERISGCCRTAFTWSIVLPTIDINMSHDIKLSAIPEVTLSIMTAIRYDFRFLRRPLKFLQEQTRNGLSTEFYGVN